MANEALRALLTEAGWRPETFAKRIAARARREGLRVSPHEKTPYSWLRDDRQPHDPIPQLACAALTDRLGRTLNPDDLGWPARADAMPRADDGLGRLWFAGGAILGLEEVASGMYRRTFLTLTGSTLPAPTLHWLVADTSRLAAALDGGNRLDDQVVTDLERLADLRRHMDDQLGGGALQESLTSDLRLVSQLLTNGSYPEVLGRRLYAVAAELARLAGWCAHDTGNEGAAQRYWIIALRSAEEARNKPLGAHVLMVMGIQSEALGNHQDGLALYNSAKKGAELDPLQRAVIAAAEAGVHARLGDSRATSACAEATFSALERSRVDEAPAWITLWGTTAQLSGDVGSAFLHLGEPGRAIPYLTTAMDGLPESCVRDRAHRGIRLATAQLRTGEADQALTTAHHATDLVATLSSEKVRGILADFCREASSTVDNTAARELADHARTALHA